MYLQWPQDSPLAIWLLFVEVMPAVCRNAHEPWFHSSHLSKTGLCFACCGRQSRGNTTKGKKKRDAALKGRSQGVSHSGGSRVVRRSLVTNGFTKVKCRLVKLLQDRAPASVVASYARSVVKKIHAQHADMKIRVTFIEGPSFPGSRFAAVNAELGGASLRIVEPNVHGVGPARSLPPRLKLGRVVDWPLDLFTKGGVEALQKFLHEVKPCRGTKLLHYAWT